MTGIRLESDSLGQVEVPADKLWGAQNEPGSSRNWRMRSCTAP
jgi:fumarate hydratase class II